MKKVNAYAFMDDEADQKENWLWYAIEDGKLLVQSEPDGPVVALSDQALVWLAIEGLCRLREDGDDTGECYPSTEVTDAVAGDKLCCGCHGEKPA